MGFDSQSDSQAKSVIKLSRVERLILANQFEILSLLQPDDAELYNHRRTAIEDGFELEYEHMLERFDDGLSADGCREVVDILEMHRALLRSYKALPDKAGIDATDVEFAGFDGNEEPQQFAYCRYFCDDPSQKRYSELSRADDFNSHAPSLSRYRKMLHRWRESSDRNRLSADDIKRVTEIP